MGQTQRKLNGKWIPLAEYRRHTAGEDPPADPEPLDPVDILEREDYDDAVEFLGTYHDEPLSEVYGDKKKATLLEGLRAIVEGEE